MLRPVPLLLVASLVLCGCDTFGKKPSPIQERDLWGSFTPTDQSDPTEEVVDDWSFVGTEARGNQMLERDPDPWWQMNFMSDKARMIERNVGIAGPDE
jgi:hypothetical protein